MYYGTKRNDIQILRALAVLLVIVFHLNEEWLPYGYLGVDMFFVISGYVITRSIWYRNIKGIPFNIHTFFARRIARLLPALLFTIVVSFTLGFLLYSPADFSSLTASAIYAIGGLSNIFFFTQTDYFSAPLETMPLLHTWSLSVEEQFYILFALVSSALTLLSVNFIRWSILIWMTFLVASLYFVFSELSWVSDLNMIRELALDDAASAFEFYLLPSRVYQLALGVLGACLVAMFGVVPLSYAMRQLVWWGGVVGVFLIILIINASLSSDVIALVVCLIVLLMLVVGEGSKDVVRQWSMESLVLIGNRSYSLYLVHWPVTVFISYYMTGEYKLYSIAISVVVIVLLGEISFRLFERRRWFSSDHTTGVSAVFVYILLLVTSALFFVTQNEGLAFRVESNSVDKFYQYRSSSIHNNRDGLPKVDDNGEWVSYTQDSPKTGPVSERVLVLGDSHAGHLNGMARYYASTRNHSWTIYNFTGCPPVFGYYKVYGIYEKHEGTKQKACRRQTSLWKNYITKYASDYDVVVLSARWNWMFNHDAFNGKNLQKSALVKIDEGKTTLLEQSRMNFITGLSDTVSYIQSLGLRVVVFGQPPLSTIRLETCNNAPKYIFDDKKLNSRCNFDPYIEMVKRGEFVDNVLRNPESFGMPYFDKLIATDVFCDHEKMSCERIYYGQTMFNDDNHYNKYGALYLAKTWEKSKSFPLK